MIGARLVGGVLIAAVVTFIHPAAVLAGERTCELDPDTGQLKCVLVAQPAPAKAHRLSAALPLVWHRVPMQIDDLISRGIGCVRDVPGGVDIGVGYAVWLENAVTDENLYVD